jgi:hypothetical protein
MGMIPPLEPSGVADLNLLALYVFLIKAVKSSSLRALLALACVSCIAKATAMTTMPQENGGHSIPYARPACENRFCIIQSCSLVESRRGWASSSTLGLPERPRLMPIDVEKMRFEYI